MPFGQIINYDTPGNFVFDSNKVEFVGSLARLKIVNNPGQSFVQPFSSDTGFTYDNTKSEFAAGLVRQKDQTPVSSVMGSRLTTKDLLWHKSGSLTGTLNGSPTFAASGMTCTTGQGVYFDKTSAAKETVRFKWKSSFTGGPPTNINMVSGNPSSGNNGQFGLTYSPSGNNFRIFLYNATGTLIYTATTIGGTFSATTGVTYEFGLVIDSVAGTVRLFIDGVLHGTLSPGAFTRGGTALRYYVGATPVVYNEARGEFSDPMWHDDALWTATYTPGYTVPLWIYAGTPVDLPTPSYPGVGSLQAFTGFTSTESNSPRWILSGKWWNGSAWVASNGTYAEANPIATANTNIGTLPAVASPTIRVVFTDQNVQGSVDISTLSYTGQTYDLSDPSIVTAGSVLVDGIYAFMSTFSQSGSDAVKFVLVVGGVDKYWNGSAWVTSSGYGQSNTATEINTNVSSYDLSLGYSVKIKAYLHAATGLTTPTLTDVMYAYDFFVSTPGDPSRCVLYGFLNDMIGLIKDTPQQAKLIVETFSVFNYGDRMIGPYRRVFRFDANGYVETTPGFLEVVDASAEDGLVETETLSLTPYKLTVQYRNSDGKLVTFGVDGIEVPNQVSKNLKEYDFA